MKTHPADKYYAEVDCIRDLVGHSNKELVRLGWDACQKNIGKGVPSLTDVDAYCRERNNGINPQMFWDHYQSNGWMVGKTKMKDWKAAVRYWEHNNALRAPVQRGIRAVN